MCAHNSFCGSLAIDYAVRLCFEGKTYECLQGCYLGGSRNGQEALWLFSNSEKQLYRIPTLARPSNEVGLDAWPTPHDSSLITDERKRRNVAWDFTSWELMDLYWYTSSVRSYNWFQRSISQFHTILELASCQRPMSREKTETHTHTYAHTSYEHARLPTRNAGRCRSAWEGIAALPKPNNNRPKKQRTKGNGQKSKVKRKGGGGGGRNREGCWLQILKDTENTCTQEGQAAYFTQRYLVERLPCQYTTPMWFPAMTAFKPKRVIELKSGSQPTKKKTLHLKRFQIVIIMLR